MDGATAEFDQGTRAGANAGRLFRSCKALLRCLERGYAQTCSDLGDTRARISDPAIVDAMTLVAEIEGRPVHPDPLLMWSVWGQLCIGAPGYRAIYNAGVVTFADLVQRSAADLLAIPGIGAAELRAIVYALSTANLELPTPNAAPDSSHPLYSLPYDSLIDLPTYRHVDILRRAGIVTVGDLAKWSVPDLLSLYGFGVESLARVEDGLAPFGLVLEEPAMVRAM